eukprot:jgi/Undpi1/5832/HiC_scaffold_2.g01106.m1
MVVFFVMACGSMLVLPMVVLNMGGEMINILRQRLDAQLVDEVKGDAVLRDVLSAMYAPEFVEELFKPQEMCSEMATRELFYKLAHASIMRLNKTSMDKLFDLISMGFKYQALLCCQPQQLLQVTLNHMETLKKMIPSLGSLSDSMIEMTVASYRHLDTYGWMQLRHRLLEFFQDRRVKISLFLQYNVQLMDGTLVLDPAGKLPVGVECPGLIRYHELDDPNPFVVSLPMSSAEKVGVKLTTYVDFDSPLGTDIYKAKPHSALDPGATGIRTRAIETAADALAEAAKWKPSAKTHHHRLTNTPRAESKSEGTSSGMVGLNLLASLLGASAKDGADGGDTDGGGGGGGGGASGAKRRGERETFNIKLFPDDPFDEAQAKDEGEVNTINIDLTSSHTGCAKMLQDLDLSDDRDNYNSHGGNEGDTNGAGKAGGGGAARSDIKGMDDRTESVGLGGGAAAKGGDEGRRRGREEDDDLDDLLDLMDSTAESK